MSLWGNRDQADNAPKNKNIVAQNPARGNVVYSNTTVSAFVNNEVIGLYGAATSEANDAAGIAHTGWVLAKQGTGPVTGFVVNPAGSSGFVTGETVKVSNGSVNAVGVVTSNATGNLVSIAVSNAGAGFINTGAVAVTFNREKYLANVTVTGTTSGYSNTDVITASNGSVNASATVSTNSTGGITNTSFTITTKGLFGTSTTNSQVVVAIANSTGGNSAGTGATFSVNLANSTGGSATVTLGGRSGRIQYETLVATGSIVNNATGSVGI